VYGKAEVARAWFWQRVPAWFSRSTAYTLPDGLSPWGRKTSFLPCSAGVRFLPGLKAGASSEGTW